MPKRVPLQITGPLALRVRWVERLLPDTFVECERKAAIWAHGTTVDYPFQANLHGLPPEVVSECLIGFVEANESLHHYANSEQMLEQGCSGGGEEA